MEPSATSSVVIRPVGERLQVGTEDGPVLDYPAPLRHLHDFGAGYKYPDLIAFLHLFYLLFVNNIHDFFPGTLIFMPPSVLSIRSSVCPFLLSL